MRALTALAAAVTLLAQPVGAVEIEVPDGFAVQEVHDGVGRARHLTVAPNGDIFVALRTGRLVALRDQDGDGAAERMETRNVPIETGIEFHNGYLYFSDDTSISRLKLETGTLMPEGPIETVVDGFPEQSSHAAKPLAFDTEGYLYAVSGAPSNACQQSSRSPGSPGLDPCPQLLRQGGIWRFPADTLGQTQSDGTRHVTGLRHAVGLDWHDGVGKLGFVMHGRDQLNSLWPERFDDRYSAENPAEEFHFVEASANLGWPYTYWNPQKGARLVAPEYGGTEETVSTDPDYQAPLHAFPAHWAPNDILFYDGEAFPDRYTAGAFIAFHGSWNRSPFPQQGYRVVFLPLGPDGEPGTPEDFATAFAGPGPVETSSQAETRPMGLALDPAGNLLISDSVKGRIWRVTPN